MQTNPPNLPPKNTFPRVRGNRMWGFPHQERLAAGWCRSRPQAKYALLCILFALKHTWPTCSRGWEGRLTLFSSKKQPPQPPLKQLGWILESSPCTFHPSTLHVMPVFCFCPLLTGGGSPHPKPQAAARTVGCRALIPAPAGPGQESADSGGPGLLTARPSC